MTQRGAWTPEKVRKRIRTGVLVHRLYNHVLGKVEMTATQVKAADIMLRKLLPDLQRTELTGEGGGPVALVQATPEDEGI